MKVVTGNISDFRVLDTVRQPLLLLPRQCEVLDPHKNAVEFPGLLKEPLGEKVSYTIKRMQLNLS